MSLGDPNIVHPTRRKRIAIVVANPTVSTSTGWPVGFWWSELTHPYRVFTEAGFEVEVFSPDGGACEGDAMSDPDDASGYSRSDLVSRGFLHTPELRALVALTRPVDAIAVDAFDAVLVAGGQSPMFSFATAPRLHAKFAEFHAAGKIAAALCHGVAVLAFARDGAGRFIAEGRTVTGFANCEEDAADGAVWDLGLLPRDRHVMPWRIEDRLREIGANFIQAGPWKRFAVRDGNLVTGQQNFSGEETARLVVEALGR